MELSVQGILIALLPTTSGDTQSGKHWVRGGFVIETEEQYPVKIAFTIFGEERVSHINSFQVGTPLSVSFNPESREYNGKWYTDLRAYSVVLITQQQQQAPPQPQYPYAGQQQPMQQGYQQTPVQQQPQMQYPMAGFAPQQTPQSPMQYDSDLPF